MVAIAPPAASTWVADHPQASPGRGFDRGDGPRGGDVARDRVVPRGVPRGARERARRRLGRGRRRVDAGGARAAAAPAGERVAVLQDADEIAIGAGAGRAAVAVRPRTPGARRPCGPPRASGPIASSSRRWPGRWLRRRSTPSARGARACSRASARRRLRHGLARLASQVALARPGALDRGLARGGGRVVRRGRRGRRARPTGGSACCAWRSSPAATARASSSRDLFVLSADGTGEGAYAATGTVPRLGERLRRARREARRGSLQAPVARLTVHGPSALDVRLELAVERRQAELAQRLRLDLTDALARELEALADLLEREVARASRSRTASAAPAPRAARAA